MKSRTRLVVFSDLDGTLLDHHDYSWTAANPALAALRTIGAPLVLCSSKTATEIESIQRDLGIAGTPAIVENGAGMLGDAGTGADDYKRLRDMLNTLPTVLRTPFQGFGDMDAARVARITGLGVAAAAAAKMRAFSEPGLWSGSAAGRAAFIDALAQMGIAAREGGRFLTLSFGATKADRMAQIIAKYAPDHTIALGDAPNDVEMLCAADHGVIVANPARQALPELSAEAEGRIIRTTKAGPAGWNDAVLRLIRQLGLNQERENKHG